MATRKTKAASKMTAVTVNHSTEIHLDVDDEKVAAIKRCLEKGKLKITISKFDLAAGGRAKGGYAYD